jgi:hypothetical protein
MTENGGQIQQHRQILDTDLEIGSRSLAESGMAAIA